MKSQVQLSIDRSFLCGTLVHMKGSMTTRTGHSLYKGKLRNAKGQYSSIRPVVFLILLALVILFLTLNAVFNAPLRSPCPENNCFVSEHIVPQVYAKDDISDPLFLEIKDNPIKKDIYMNFGQISTKVAREALEVAKQESGFNPNAKNPNSSAKGIFQIIDGTWKLYKCTGSVLDYDDNIKCAVKIYKSNGSWRQWVAQPIKI